MTTKNLHDSANDNIKIDGICIIALLYKKQHLKDSPTLCQLKKQNMLGGGTTLVIVNNGPEEISTLDVELQAFETKFSRVEYHPHLENCPLSKIYNTYVQRYPASKYIIFDDDSCPDDTFFGNAVDPHVDILFPEILSKEDGCKYYPLHKGTVSSSTCSRDVINIDDIMTISSGLVISGRTIADLTKRFGRPFDERYALYGIDTSFIVRVRNLVREDKNPRQFLSAGKIYHSLSKVSEKHCSRREVERLYDVAITTRWYPEHYGYKTFLRKFVSSIVKRKFKNTRLLLHTFIKGKHPKC